VSELLVASGWLPGSAGRSSRLGRPFLFLIYSIVKPVTSVMILVVMYWSSLGPTPAAPFRLHVRGQYGLHLCRQRPGGG